MCSDEFSLKHALMDGKMDAWIVGEGLNGCSEGWRVAWNFDGEMRCEQNTSNK